MAGSGFTVTDFMTGGGKRWTGKILGKQVPVALSHYGDSSDYEGWNGLLPLHLIALGNTKRKKQIESPELSYTGI